MQKIFLIIFLCSISSSFALAQNHLQSPEEFLGYALGERFTPHHKVLEYYQYIADNSPQVILQEYGESYEQRPLLVAFVSTAENLGSLEDTRINNLRMAGLEAGQPASGSPAIVWLSYNVHGNESVSTEAALATLHAITNPADTEKQAWLENTLVIMDPCLNPDGRERYVNFYKQNRSIVPNPQLDAKEHHEPWPGGRGNHYLFDLNRDWAWQTQVESQQRIALYNQWMPHVHVDFHEQAINSPYYFAPAAEPFHEVITDWQREFQTTIGKNNARYFDENSWLYFTGERFDLFYPSYGDTYPTYNGAIGMTYEQGGSGRAGLAVLTNEEDTLTLADRIAHHHTAGLSTVEITSQNAEEVVGKFQEYFDRAINNPDVKYKSYLISGSNAPDKLQALKEFLDKNGITYGYANNTRSVKGFNYQNGAEGSFSPATNDLVISAYQPRSNMVKVLFEPVSSLSDSITYDITAWAIPYMYGLEAYAATERIASTNEVQNTAFTPTPVSGNPYAYISNWQGLNDLRWLGYLLKNKVKVRFAEEAFETEGKNFAAGSLILTRAGNENLGEKFDEIIKESAQAMQINIIPVSSGFVTSGKDFGSGGVRYIHAPRVALMSGEGVSSLAFGEVWHFFEQQIGYPVTVLGTEYFNGIDLEEYDVLIMPDGSYGSVDEKMLEKLGGWVNDGGKLILLQGALSAFADKKDFGLSEYANEEEEKEAEDLEENVAPEDRLRKYGNREREDISDYISGGIVKLTLDNSHPMAFGYPGHYFSLKNDSDHYAFLKDGWNVGVIRNERDLVSGFAGYKAQDKLENSLVFGVEDKGKGTVIYMADNPLFRAFWHNGKLLFGNAVFLVGQ